MSDSRSCSARNGSGWKSESSQRSSASPSSRSSSAASSLAAQLGGEAAAELVQPRRLAVRLRRRDRQDRADAVGPPVEALEQHRPGGDRPRRREAERGHGIGDLSGRVRRLRLALAQAALELDDREAVGLAAEVRRQQALRLGPVRGELARRSVAHANAVAEVDHRADARRRRAARRPHRHVPCRRASVRAPRTRRRTPRSSQSKPPHAFGGRDQQRQDDRAEERVVLARAPAGVGAREDPRRRLAAQLLEREPASSRARARTRASR